MLLLEPNETRWDLRWRMFGIPVRVHPMFWIIAAVMGGDTLKMGVQYLLAWVGCVFVSILIHELGHVTMGLLFGAHGHVVLYSFGGLAVGSNQLQSRWQRIAVCFAGPLAGFLFLGAVFAFVAVRDPLVLPFYFDSAKADLGIPVARAIRAADLDADVLDALRDLILRRRIEFFIVEQLIFINLLWGLLNLLPVWPLDGGQISRDVCLGIAPENGLRTSLGISLVIAGLLALNCIMAMNGRPFLPIRTGSWWPALLFGLLALQSFQLLQQAEAQRREHAEWTDRHWQE